MVSTEVYRTNPDLKVYDEGVCIWLWVTFSFQNYFKNEI